MAELPRLSHARTHAHERTGFEVHDSIVESFVQGARALPGELLALGMVKAAAAHQGEFVDAVQQAGR